MKVEMDKEWQLQPCGEKGFGDTWVGGAKRTVPAKTACLARRICVLAGILLAGW